MICEICLKQMSNRLTLDNGKFGGSGQIRTADLTLIRGAL